MIQVSLIYGSFSPFVCGFFVRNRNFWKAVAFITMCLKLKKNLFINRVMMLSYGKVLEWLCYWKLSTNEFCLI